MTCRLFGAKPLSEPMLVYLDTYEQISVSYESNMTIFIKETALETIFCKMSAILVLG